MCLLYYLCEDHFEFKGEDVFGKRRHFGRDSLPLKAVYGSRLRLRVKIR